MQNIEFKAELRNLEAARRQCELIEAERLGEIRQIDTYFRMTDGRLKRREAAGAPIEWILYHRYVGDSQPEALAHGEQKPRGVGSG
jgi:hypothetical protein